MTRAHVAGAVRLFSTLLVFFTFGRFTLGCASGTRPESLSQVAKARVSVAGPRGSSFQADSPFPPTANLIWQTLPWGAEPGISSQNISSHLARLAWSESASLPPGVAGLTRLGPNDTVEVWVRPSLGLAEETHVIRHEAVHAWALLLCPALADPRLALANEALAIEISGDDRGLHDNSFAFRKEALAFLRDRVEQRGAEGLASPRAQAALRDILIASPNLREGLGELRNLVPFCNERTLETAFDIQRSVLNGESTPISGLTKKESARAVRAAVLLDIRSGRILERSGSTDRSFPLGSVLKPFAVAAFPSWRRPLFSRQAQDLSWACPLAHEAPRRWTVDQALARSCNGFFLDSVPPSASQRKEAEELLRRFSWSGTPRGAQDWIGLRPVVEGSPLHVAQAARWLALSRPEELHRLKGTMTEGTLSTTKPASLWARRDWLVKSGTVRSLDGSPRLGWLVVWSLQDGWVATMLREGQSPLEMTEDFERWYQTSSSFGGTGVDASIQVGAAVPNGAAAWICRDAFSRSRPFDIVDLSLKEVESRVTNTKDEWFCLSGPWQLRAWGSSRTKEFWGSLKRAQGWRRAPSMRNVSVREARARSGSPFLGRTSELEYVSSVLASEGAALRSEAQRALALIATENLHWSLRHGQSGEAPRHALRGLCDTTHCQVAFMNEPTSLHRANSFWAISKFRESGAMRSPRWRLFSRGGAEPWVRSHGRRSVRLALGLGADLDAIRRSGRQVELVLSGGPSLKRSCEWLRSRLRLPSCPDHVSATAHSLQFAGRGEGHGLGLDLERADALAAEGAFAADILKLARSPFGSNQD